MQYVDSLSPYMLTCKNMSTFTRYLNVNKSIPTPKPFKVTETPTSVFIPYQEDKLFWILYNILNGYAEYNMVGSNSYRVEMDEKVKWCQLLKEKKSIFKEYKLKKVVETADSLISIPKMSFKAFEMLCICFNINFIMIKDRMYHKITTEDNISSLYIIHYINEMYGSEEIQYADVDHYETNRYHVEFYEKPIRAVGSYKIDELQSIARVLNIPLTDECEKRLNKQDLYASISTTIGGMFNDEN